MYKIGFDAKRLFHNGTGLGNYSRRLVRSLKEFYPDNSYVLFSPSVTYNDESFYFTQEFETVTPGLFSSKAFSMSPPPFFIIYRISPHPASLLSNTIFTSSADIFSDFMFHVPDKLKFTL